MVKDIKIDTILAGFNNNMVHYWSDKPVPDSTNIAMLMTVPVMFAKTTIKQLSEAGLSKPELLDEMEKQRITTGAAVAKIRKERGLAESRTILPTGFNNQR